MRCYTSTDVKGGAKCCAGCFVRLAPGACFAVEWLGDQIEGRTVQACTLDHKTLVSVLTQAHLRLCRGCRYKNTNTRGCALSMSQP
jgi:hypothetical protein